ncbi:MAG: MG2 domain-containing protein, partial [Armatimonadota bacterium]
MRHGLRWKWSALVAVSAVAVSGVLGLRAAPPAAPMSGPTTPPKPDGLDFRVSEGRAVATESSERLPEAPATRLSDAEAERLLSRLEPVKVVPEDTTDFRVREESVPPPRAGRTIDTTFPPPAPATPPAVDPGPLAVVRVAPQGDVPVLDRITVTFNQPMVPVSSVDTVSRVAPVELTPKVEGNWRWLGTRTVVFDPGSGKRLPTAKVFRATVPAGTRSASGATLAEPVSVEVRTPAPRVVASGPAGPGIARTPIVWMAFDQRIDAPALARRLQWLANGVKPRVRLATEAEIGKAPGIPAAGDVPRDRLLAVVVLEPLPADIGVAVRLPKGAPSAEGPRTTDNDHLVQFRTYAALKLVRGQCGWNDQAPCRPEDPWRIEFNNPLDAEAFDPAWVTVSPKVPGSEPTVQGNNLFLGGMRKGRTQYTVSISPRLRDIHGQTLGASDAVVFKVGPAAPNLLPPPGGFQVADPAAPPRIEFQSVNLRRIAVQVRAVDPDDWEAWTTAQENPEGKANWPGRVVIDRALIPGGDNDAWTRSSLDLSAALVNGRGNVIVTWSAVLGSKALPEGERTVRGASWIQSTRIGLSVHADPTDLLAWATDLATGKPLPGAKVRLAGTGTTVATGADGLARFDLGPTPARRIEVRVGDDIAFLPARFWRWDDGGWRRQQRVAALRWYAFDDRGLYKPGETVRVKGWLRRQEPGKAGPLTIPADIKSMPWSLRDAVGNEVAKGTTRLNAWGGFDLSVALPKTMNLGDAFLQVGDFGRQVKVQEFRRPEFEVAARSETEGPHVVGGVPAEVSVKAAYYAGGGLAGAATHWSVTARKARYSPPGHDGFTFGEWRPWWIRDAPEFGGDVVFARGRMAGGGHPFEEPGEEKTFDGATDPSGVHRVRIDFDAVRPARPYTVHAQATVQDVNRQALAATTDLLVHPSERYVGVRSERTFVEEGKPYGFEAIACGIDGAMDAGRTLRFRAFRRVSRWSKGRFTEVEADPIAWTVASGKGPVRTEFTPKTGGVWTLEAVVEDAKGRPNRTVTTVWVTGGPVESQRDLAKETVELIPAKQVHAPGETATVLVRAPFAPAEGLLTLRHNGFVRTERFTMTGRTRVLRFPVVGDWMPNVEVQVDLTGAAPRVGEDGKPVAGAKPRPAYASGNLSLDVETKARRLVVSARPAEARVEPGGKTSVEVAVQGADGKPVPGAEVALVVVDEAVLALAGWDPGDPLAALLPRVPGDVQDWYLRDHVRLEDPARVLDSSGAAGGAMPAAAMPMMVADGAVAEGRAGGGRFLAKAV